MTNMIENMFQNKERDMEKNNVFHIKYRNTSTIKDLEER